MKHYLHRNISKRLMATLGLFILLLSSSYPHIACNQDKEKDEYDIYINQNQKPQISFEYPINYGIVTESTNTSNLYIEIHKNRYLYPSIYIKAESANDKTVSDIKTIAEQNYGPLSTSSNITDFKIQNRETKFINEIQAEYVSYTFTYHENNELSLQTGKITVMIDRELIWIILGVSEMKDSDEFEVVYNRILETFKILD